MKPDYTRFMLANKISDVENLNSINISKKLDSETSFDEGYLDAANDVNTYNLDISLGESLNDSICPKPIWQSYLVHYAYSDG